MPTHRTFYSLDKLLRAADRLADDVDVITLDVFDTLLVRRLHDPDLVKVPVARYISALAEQAGNAIEWQQVQEQRDEIEAQQRAEAGQNHPDHEAHYPTLMKTLLESLLGDHYSEQVLEEVTDFELMTENAMLVPRAPIKQWVEKMAGAGKQLIALSDMYLPASHIGRLLQHAGYDASIKTVISSADSFEAKASGAGYRRLIETRGMDPARTLHIGDNPISDGLRAAEHGFHALVLRDPEEARRKAVAARYYYYSRSRAFWRGRAVQQLMAPLEAENVPRSALYREGYNFIGPLICMFVQSVAEHCRRQGISKIFFLSREGWMFREVWNRITPFLYPEGNLPETEYLYVSRLSLAGASCAVQGLTPDNASIVFLPPGNKNFTDVCRIFALDSEPLVPHLARHDMTLETTLSPLHKGFDPEHSWRFEQLLGDALFQDEVKRQAQPKNAALQSYLESVDFYGHDDVALVDIGWLGTIQRFFHHAIRHREDRPTCHGLLFGATRGIPFDTTPDNHIRGMIYDRDRFSLGASAIMYARDIFEEACRAPHPTTVGYRVRDDGSAEPVFREMTDTIGKSEIEQDAHYSDLQQGILDAAGRYGAAANIIASNTDGFRPWIHYLLVSKLAFPKAGEIRALRYRHHLDDFHGASKPTRIQRPKLFHNPWETRGLRAFFGRLFAGRVFRAHVRQTLTR